MKGKVKQKELQKSIKNKKQNTQSQRNKIKIKELESK